MRALRLVVALTAIVLAVISSPVLAAAPTGPFGPRTTLAAANVGSGGVGDINARDAGIVGYSLRRTSVARWWPAGPRPGRALTLGRGFITDLTLAEQASIALAILGPVSGRGRDRAVLITPRGVVNSGPVPGPPPWAQPAGGEGLVSRTVATRVHADGSAVLAVVTTRSRVILSDLTFDRSPGVLRFVTRSRQGVWREDPASALRLENLTGIAVRFTGSRGVVVAWEENPTDPVARSLVLAAARPTGPGGGAPSTGQYGPGWQRLPVVMSTPAPPQTGSDGGLRSLDVTDAGTIVVGATSYERSDAGRFDLDFTGRVYRLPRGADAWQASDPLRNLEDVAVGRSGVVATTRYWSDATRTRIRVNLQRLSREGPSWGAPRPIVETPAMNDGEPIGTHLVALGDGRVLVNYETQTGPGPDGQFVLVVGPRRASRVQAVCANRSPPLLLAGDRRALVLCDEDGGEGVFTWNIGRAGP